MSEIRFLVGVDGGGTKCRAALATADGRMIGFGEAGSANITTDLETASSNIMGAINQAYATGGIPASEHSRTSAWLGLAGATVGPFARMLHERLPFAIAEVDGDAPIALQGALNEGDGAIAILGTGSAFLRRKGSEFRLIGGWGFNLSDHGGGARLGHAALEQALMAHDGMRPKGTLTQEILSEFSGEPGNIVLFAKSAKPADYGRFAPMVVKHAEAGDGDALMLMREQAGYVDAGFDALCDDTVSQIALLGGLADHMANYLAERHRKHLVKPRANALTGAVELAGKLARGEIMQKAGR